MERLAEQPNNKANYYSHEKRLYDDTTTWLAEVLDGSMRTDLPLNFRGHELYGRDGAPLRKVFTKSVTEAEKIAEGTPNLAFELRRRWTEWGEYKDMLAMAAGELPNTMIVVSDFPAELMDAKAHVGGYNTTRKQTMLRVISRQPDGSMRLQSQSLDGSDREALEAIYEVLGEAAEPGELLAQRVHINAQNEDQLHLIDTLTGAYDRVLSKKYGGQWYAGRQGTPKTNTYEFVRSQQDLLSEFLAQGTGPNEIQLLNLAVQMETRFSGRTPDFNKIYSGCGLSLSRLEQENIDLSAAGYGNKTEAESKYSFDKKMHCVVCQAPPKNGESKKMCGPCGICRSCDAKLSVK